MGDFKMTKNKIFNIQKPKLKNALTKMLTENKVAKHGELSETENGFSFTYSQFGTTTVTITLNEIEENKTELSVNFDIAPTHKIVLTQDTINNQFDRYSNQLVEKYI